MTSPAARFAFIDAVHAAELLHVAQEQVVDWVKEGRLRAFGGRPANPFLRSSDVLALAEELGVSSTEGAPKRTKSASARVQTRLTADSRWAEVSEADIKEWAERADPARREAAAKVAAVARQRLETLDRALEGGSQ